MVIRLATLICLIALFGAATSVATAGTDGPVEVLCWNSHFPQEGKANVKSTPKNCSLYRRGFDFEAAGAVHMRHLKWRGWGNRTAVATGQYAEFMDVDDPWKEITVKLRKPLERCGHTVYSRAVFHVPGVKGHGGFPIWIC